MPIPRPVYQLSLNLDIDIPNDETASVEDAKLKSESSRMALELLYGKSGAPRWLDDYLELCKGGWPWRVAAYIAWASTPRGSREPKTQEELARFHLGLTRYITDPKEVYALELERLQRCFSEIQRVGEEVSDPTKVGWRQVEYLRHMNFMLITAVQVGDDLLRLNY